MVRLGELQAASVHMSSKRMFEDVRCLAVCMMCMYLTNESCDLSSYMYVHMLCTHASRTTEGTHTLYNKICTTCTS